MTDLDRPTASDSPRQGSGTGVPAEGPGAGASATPSLGNGSESPDAPVRPAATVQVAAAHQQLLMARKAFAADLDGLTSSTKASLDIPARIRKDPLKAAALASGAAFLILGGPKKVLKGVGRALPKRKRDLSAGLLPDEVEKVLRGTDIASDPRVREALDHDFAEYLRRKGRTDAQPSARASLWRTYDVVVGPLGTVGARMLVEKLMAANGGGKDRSGAAAKAPGTRPRG